MKIALIGYGKMGKAIEKIALERGHTINLKISSQNKALLTKANLQNLDVAIEFSRPESVVENIKLCAESNLPIVVGTTAWYDHYEQVKNIIKLHNGALLAETNFSVGVNLFFELNERLAKMMNKHIGYHATIDETHHTQKLDSPSGTAISLAEGIISNHEQYHTWKEQDNFEDKVLNIKAHRVNDVPGTHKITYSSEIDSLSIEHTAHNRTGFALGAVLAAEYLKNKTGIFSMKDVIKL